MLADDLDGMEAQFGTGSEVLVLYFIVSKAIFNRGQVEERLLLKTALGLHLGLGVTA